MDRYLHSVELDREKCIGCTDCIKRCPTEAIRVRDGKAVISDERCIDCGTCIRVCKNKAKRAATDPLSSINKFNYKVALPAPTLYSQFKQSFDLNTILTATKALGFDETLEIARAAEFVTYETKKLIETKDLKTPIISSACPAVVRLVTMRFPSLIDNLLPIIAPVEAAAIAARTYITKTGINKDDIGVFFISPCAAKATIVRSPIGIKKSNIDGVISLQEVYMRLNTEIKRISRPEPLCQSSPEGIDWALSGGESRGIRIRNSISVDGIENVINVLEELENGQLEDVEFIECLACLGGCIGGPLTVENTFVAKNRLKKSEMVAHGYKSNQRRYIDYPTSDIPFEFNKKIEPVGALSLSDDMGEAIRMMEEQKEIFDSLPHIDCGSCGAPTCNTLAEDIVRGHAKYEDCIFMMRKKVHELANQLADLAMFTPPSIETDNSGRKKGEYSDKDASEILAETTFMPTSVVMENIDKTKRDYTKFASAAAKGTNSVNTKGDTENDSKSNKRRA